MKPSQELAGEQHALEPLGPLGPRLAPDLKHEIGRSPQQAIPVAGEAPLIPVSGGDSGQREDVGRAPRTWGSWGEAPAKTRARATSAVRVRSISSPTGRPWSPTAPSGLVIEVR